jgi:mannose-6-phosphate isomerase-like protein (cupin superfamily)
MVYVGTKDNGPFHEMPEPEKRILRLLISPELDPTQKDIACGMVEIPPGSNSDFRGHDEGELFIIVSGKGKARVGEEEIKLAPFTAFYAKPGVPHQTFNTSDKEDLVMFFVLVSPFGGDKRIIDMWKAAQGKA